MNSNPIQAAYEKQQTNKTNVARTGAKERIGKLKRLRQAIMEQRQDIAAAIAADFGKHPVETDITEILPVLCELRHTIRHLARWMKPKRVGTPLVLFGTRSFIRYEPRGVVLIIAPWNYPLTLMLNPLIAAIAAGNCAIVKTSEKVPHTSAFLVQFINSLFPEEEIAVFAGDKIDNAHLFELQYDHIFFTGSTRVGKLVMSEAARHLTPVTLEMSGKSPAIVDETADIEKAAQRILFGKFLNAGQTCVAPDYVLLHRTRLDAFISHAEKILSRRYPAGSDGFARLINGPHRERLRKMLDRSLEQGATVAIGGPVDTRRNFMPPTIVTGVTPDSPLMTEEIFGPILPVVTFDTQEDAVEIIRGREIPLALYLFSSDRKNSLHLLNTVRSGGACLNTTVIHLVNGNLPFGGIGTSGIGSYHGFHGFETLSHKRAVLEQGPIDILRLFYPPYSSGMKRRIDALIHHLS